MKSPALPLALCFLAFLPACASLKDRLAIRERNHTTSPVRETVVQNKPQPESQPETTKRADDVNLASASHQDSDNAVKPAVIPPIPDEPLAIPLSTDVSTTQTEIAAGPPANLSLADIEQLALTHNPTLAQAEANVDAASGQWHQAGLYPNPQVGYSSSEVGNGGAAGQHGVYVSQQIVRGNKLGLAQHAQAHNVGRLESNREAQRYRVLTSARTSFYAMMIAQQRVVLAKELVRIGEEGLKNTEALVKAKQVSKIDQLQAQVELNKARIILRQAENRKTAAWTELATIIGRPDWKIIPVDGKFTPTVEKLDSDSIIEQIFANSPELAAAKQDIARQHAALQRARVEPIPNVTVQAGIQYDYGTNDPITNFQVGLPLPVRNRNEGNIQAAYAKWMAASRNVERLELALRNRLASVLEQYRNAGYQVERYTKSVLPDAKETLKLVNELYKRGDVNYLRLLTAQRTYFQTELDALNSQSEWWRARLQIDGLLLTGGLNAPDE